jgi:hypothetical protein
VPDNDLWSLDGEPGSGGFEIRGSNELSAWRDARVETTREFDLIGAPVRVSGAVAVDTASRDWFVEVTFLEEDAGGRDSLTLSWSRGVWAVRFGSGSGAVLGERLPLPPRPDAGVPFEILVDGARVRAQVKGEVVYDGPHDLADFRRPAVVVWAGCKNCPGGFAARFQRFTVAGD